MTDANYIVGFQIAEKEFRVYSQINGTGKQLINWTASTAIKANMNEVNKLRITLVDGKMAFYINGTQVGVLVAGAVTTLDYVGFEIVKGDAPEAMYKVDYIKAIKLD